MKHEVNTSIFGRENVFAALFLPITRETGVRKQAGNDLGHQSYSLNA